LGLLYQDAAGQGAYEQQAGTAHTAVQARSPGGRPQQGWSLQRAPPGLPDSHPLTAPSHSTRATELSKASFLRARVPSMKVGLHDLSPPHAITLGSKFQHTNI